MDVLRRNFSLFIFWCSIQVVKCDSYSIAGLIASSVFAGVLFVVILAVAALAFAWKDASYEYLTSRGKVKVPRSWLGMAKNGLYPRTRKKSRKETEIRHFNQRRRPNLPNTWRRYHQSQGMPVSMDPRNVESQLNTTDLHESRTPVSPIVTEVESDRGSRYIPIGVSSSSRYSNYSNSNMAHFGNAAIQNNKMSVSSQSLNLSDDVLLDSASRAATLEHNRRNGKYDNLDNMTDNTAKFQRRDLYNVSRHSRYPSVDSDPGLV